MTKFFKNKDGAVVEYILVLAFIVVILVFAFPKIKNSSKVATVETEKGIEMVLSDTPVTPAPSDNQIIPKPPTAYASCNELLKEEPDTKSGYYQIRTNNGLYTVYCNMVADGGGWTRLVNHVYDSKSSPPAANLFSKTGMTSESYESIAPDGWYTQFEDKGYNRDATILGNSEGVPFTEVRVDVSVTMMWTVDGFMNSHGGNPNFETLTLEENYVDGVSITYGEKGSRKHLWTIATNAPETLPAKYAYVKSDYFVSARNDTFRKVLNKKLEQETSNPIEMRMMTDQVWYDENIGLHKYILWVR